MADQTGILYDEGSAHVHLQQCCCIVVLSRLRILSCLCVLSCLRILSCLCVIVILLHRQMGIDNNILTRKTSERAQQEEFAIQMEELTMMNMALLARNPALVTTIKM